MSGTGLATEVQDDNRPCEGQQGISTLSMLIIVTNSTLYTRTSGQLRGSEAEVTYRHLTHEETGPEMKNTLPQAPWQIGGGVDFRVCFSHPSVTSGEREVGIRTDGC